jgi:hypothetical protein
MKVAAASTTIPVTNAAMQEYAKISLRTLAIVTLPRAASPIRAATLRSLQHRGEKVKFFELEPLNARKNSGCAHARPMATFAKKLAAGVMRESSFPRRKIAPHHADKRHMDMSLVGAAPLGLGVLIALGGILVMMSYLSE